MNALLVLLAAVAFIAAAVIAVTDRPHGRLHLTLFAIALGLALWVIGILDFTALDSR